MQARLFNARFRWPILSIATAPTTAADDGKKENARKIRHLRLVGEKRSRGIFLLQHWVISTNFITLVRHSEAV